MITARHLPRSPVHTGELATTTPTPVTPAAAAGIGGAVLLGSVAAVGVGAYLIYDKHPWWGVATILLAPALIVAPAVLGTAAVAHAAGA